MYLDPGFGGMLVQALVALAAVGGGILFSFRKKIRGLFKKTNSKNANSTVRRNVNTTDDAIDTLSEKEK